MCNTAIDDGYTLSQHYINLKNQQYMKVAKLAKLPQIKLNIPLKKINSSISPVLECIQMY